MGKFFLFPLLWWITGNPFLAMIILLIVLYALDRRFIGLSPSLTRPLALSRRLSKLKNRLHISPHDNSLKLEIARIYMEKKQFRKALPLLEEVMNVYGESADVMYLTGLCHLKLGRTETGERFILQSLQLNPRVGYGVPYLRLGEAFAGKDDAKAVMYLEKFKEMNSSSCEAYYRLGTLYARMGRQREAELAFDEAAQLYRSLPRYKRRTERRWALLARLSRRKR